MQEDSLINSTTSDFLFIYLFYDALFVLGSKETIRRSVKYFVYFTLLNFQLLGCCPSLANCKGVYKHYFIF